MKWFLSLPAPLQTSLLSAITIIIIFILRDLIAWWWKERRKRKESSMSVYVKYADPLATAATSLLWRFKEIFLDEHRGAYLRAIDQRTTYDDYKQNSTVFRLASLLGWIRALKRELFSLQPSLKVRLSGLDASISEFESALADGPHIEIKRVHDLSALWCIKHQKSKPSLSGIATELDNDLRAFLHQEKVKIARDLPPEKQKKLCLIVCEKLCASLGVKCVDEDVIDETIARAVRFISVREAWIYRDWQAGIGDLMLREASTGDTRFDIIGYKEFESILSDGPENEHRWIERLSSVFLGLDASNSSGDDARYNQLQKTMYGTAKILQELAKVKKTGIKLQKQTHDLVLKVVADRAKILSGDQKNS